MQSAKRFKLYKKGKLWMAAAICTIALGLGITAAPQAKADVNNNNQSQSQLTYQQNNQIRNRFYNQNGQTYYYDASGNQLRNSWYSVGGNQYYFGSNGVMLTNQIANINGKNYQFDGGGVMQHNSFVVNNGNVYYYGDNGAGYNNQWYTNGGNKYYFDNNGQMLRNSNWTINGTAYHFDGNGSATQYNAVLVSKQAAQARSPYSAIRPATPISSIDQLTARGQQLVNVNRAQDGTNMYPVTVLGGYENITTHSGYFTNNSNAVSSENQLPLDFKPGILAYDPDNDTSEVISNDGLTEAQEMRLNDLSTQWMNSLRNEYWNVVQPQNRYNFAGRTHESLHYTDNTPNGHSAIQPLITTNDFWHNVGEMIGTEREAVNMTYDHTDSVDAYNGHTFYFEGHQHVYQPYTSVISDEINNVFKTTSLTRSQGRGWRFGENLYDLQGSTMLQMEVNLYNKMQVMLWGEFVKYANGIVGNGSHLVNALDPQAQLVTMSFQRIANAGDKPHYYVTWEFYGATDTTTFGGPNNASYAYGTADTSKNNNMRTYYGIEDTGVVNKIRSAQA